MLRQTTQEKYDKFMFEGKKSKVVHRILTYKSGPHLN